MQLSFITLNSTNNQINASQLIDHTFKQIEPVITNHENLFDRTFQKTEPQHISDSYNFEFDLHNIPSNISSEIMDSLNLDSNKLYVLAFSRFVDYDKTYHGTAINYWLYNIHSNMQMIPMDKNSPEKGVTYIFKDRKLITNNLDMEQIKFLCAVFHQLNLKKYLILFIDFLLDKYEFPEVKAMCKDEVYKMQIFCK